MKNFFEDIHYRVLKNISLNTELIYNDKDHEINEYDIQAFMTLFFRRNVNNTGLRTNREAFGKFDCVISTISSDSPVILYELKTFLKPQERLNTNTAKNKILKDFKKIKNGIQEYQKSRGYFILLCHIRNVKDVNFIPDFKFIQNHFNGKRHETKFTFDEISLKIRPSRKIIIERVVAMSWEII